MKKVSKMIISALICCAMVSFVGCCGGSSVGKDFANDLCECLAESGLGESNFAMLGCMLGLAEKYKEHFDDDQQFKNPNDEKAFHAQLKKCNPELAQKIIEENKK